MKTIKPLPVVWFRKRLHGDQNKGYAWTYPVGTIVGEVLAMTGPDGYAYSFELRVRTAGIRLLGCQCAASLSNLRRFARRIKELRPDWEDQPNLGGHRAFGRPAHAETAKTLADKQPARASVRANDGGRFAAGGGRQQTGRRTLGRRHVSFHAWRSVARNHGRRENVCARPLRPASASCRSITMPASCRSIAPVACAATTRWPGRFPISIRGAIGTATCAEATAFFHSIRSRRNRSAITASAARRRCAGIGKSRCHREVRSGQAPARGVSIDRQVEQLIERCRSKDCVARKKAPGQDS